jgi:SAM-dependent methyltransferase
LEVRSSNIAACHYVKANTNLPNLQFAQDDAWNIGEHGTFDAVFCCGLLYHLDRPRQFLRMLSGVTRRLLFLQTHFAVDDTVGAGRPGGSVDKFDLSPLTENESLRGRWYTEFPHDPTDDERDKAKWSSWSNCRSFWILREDLLQTIQDVGFDLVLEQFDSLGQGIAEAMTGGYYERERRGTFIGIKTPTRSP